MSAMRPVRVRKAVFPVAGLGTRFLPATKASPKEMLPVVDKPLIQYAVEEALAAGITELVFVTGRGKRAIEDHFDKAFEVESALHARGRHDMLTAVRDILPARASCVYVRQPEALGLGHAVLCAAPALGDEPFAVILADDLIAARTPVMKQMMNCYQERGCSVLAVERVARRDSASYGMVRPGARSGNPLPVTEIVEKPAPAHAPSNLGVVGRYILTPQILQLLRHQKPGRGVEIQLTDAISALLAVEPVLAYQFEGVRYDCGSKLGFLQANVAYGVRHPEVGRGLRRWLKAGYGG
jgi:UTP--glucose-1-phosphate uridylyltransferase